MCIPIPSPEKYSWDELPERKGALWEDRDGAERELWTSEHSGGKGGSKVGCHDEEVRAIKGQETWGDTWRLVDEKGLEGLKGVPRKEGRKEFPSLPPGPDGPLLLGSLVIVCD